MAHREAEWFARDEKQESVHPFLSPMSMWLTLCELDSDAPSSASVGFEHGLD